MEVQTDVVLPVYILSESLLDLTKQTIESIKKTQINDLIIVDNASTLGGGLLRQEADTYIRNKVNKGYAKAVNQGILSSSAQFLCVSNNDIRVPDNWLSVAMEIFEDKEVGSVHFRMTDYDEPFKFGDKTFITGRERWCTSSFFVLRVAAIPFSLYDTNYGLGGVEDYDFWAKVRSEGWKTAYTTKSCYQHLHSATQRALDQKERDERHRAGEEYFRAKWGEYPDKYMENLYPEQWKQDYYQVLAEI